MLKITTFETGRGQELMIEGKLAEPWISELQLAWHRALQHGSGREVVVDLSNMTFIDPAGEAALMAMMDEGARLTAKGVYCEYVVQELMKRTKRNKVRRQKRNGAGAKPSSSVGEASHGIQRSAMKETH